MPQLILALIALCILAVIVYLVVCYVLPALIVCGAVYGAGIALFNYFRAFIENVKPEKVGS